MAQRNEQMVKIPLPFAYSFKLFPALEKMHLKESASFKINFINEFLNFRDLYFVREGSIPENIRNAYVILYNQSQVIYVDSNGKQEILKSKSDFKKEIKFKEDYLDQIKPNIPLHLQKMSDGNLLEAESKQILEKVIDWNSGAHQRKIFQQLEIQKDLPRRAYYLALGDYLIDVFCLEFLSGLSDDQLTKKLKSNNQDISDADIKAAIQYFRKNYMLTQDEIRALVFFQNAEARGEMAQGGLLASSYLSFMNFFIFHKLLAQGQCDQYLIKNLDNTFSIRNYCSYKLTDSNTSRLDSVFCYEDKFKLIFDEKSKSFLLEAENNSVKVEIPIDVWKNYILKNAHQVLSNLKPDEEFEEKIFYLIPCLIDAGFAEAFYKKMLELENKLPPINIAHLIQGIKLCHSKNQFMLQQIPEKIMDAGNAFNHFNLLLDQVIGLRLNYMSARSGKEILYPKNIPFDELEKSAKILFKMLSQFPSQITYKQAFLTLWQQVEHYREQAELFHKTQEGNTGRQFEVKSRSRFGRIFDKTELKNEKWLKEKSTLASIIDENILDNEKLEDFAKELERNNVKPVKHKLLKEVEPKQYAHIPKQKK